MKYSVNHFDGIKERGALTTCSKELFLTTTIVGSGFNVVDAARIVHPNLLIMWKSYHQTERNYPCYEV